MSRRSIRRLREREKKGSSKKGGRLGNFEDEDSQSDKKKDEE